MSKLLKLLTFAFSVLLAIFVLPSPVNAAVGVDTLNEFQQSLSLSKQNKESFDFQSLVGVSSSLSTMVVGCFDPTCPSDIRIGALARTGDLVAGIITSPPASGMYYLADLGKKLNLVQPVYAQTGFGFNAAQPFLAAWRAMRNLSYVLFAMAAVILGISIMLRAKISPQLVLTIQSAIPRLIIGLVVITFSYAIIGLLIDLMYVVFGILVYSLHAFGLTVFDPAREFNEFRGAGFAQTIGWVLSKGIGGATDVLKGTAPGGILIGAGVAAILTAILALTPAGAAAIGAAPAIAISLIPILLGLVLAVLFFMLRILFALARSYLLLVLHIIFAPYFILVNVVLRGNNIYEGWLRGTLSHLLVFPAFGILVFFAGMLFALVDQASAVGPIWAPPYVGGGADLIKGMIALGTIMLMPTIPELIAQALDVRGLQVPLPQAGTQVQNLLGNLSQTLGRYAGGVPAGGPGPGGGPGGAPCLAYDTLIDTPTGPTLIGKLQAGMNVWSINRAGDRIITTIKSVFETPVFSKHIMVSLVLEDGRRLRVTPGHPTADGRTFADLFVGAFIDGSRIIGMEKIIYGHQFTYDIMTLEGTGDYWANGILIGSTTAYNYTGQAAVA